MLFPVGLLAALLSGFITARPAAQPPAPDLAGVTARINAGDLDAAARQLREILASEESAAAHDLLGLVLVRSGDSVAAERELRRAVELSPEYLPARLNLGRLFLQQGREAEAKGQLQAAARLAPLDRQLAVRLGEIELRSGEVDLGERRLRAVIAEHRDAVRARFLLARSLARRGENGAALAELERALETAPNAEDLLSARARVLLALQAPVPAIDTLEALTRMHPGTAEHHYLLGIAKMQIADNAGGIESLHRSLELDPGRALSHLALGLAYNEQKEYAPAKEALENTLRLLPGNVDALVSLAEAEEALGNLDAAERHVGRALDLAEDAPSALWVLGKIRMTEGRYEEARDALLRSVERHPGLAKAHYQLSLAYARLGDRESSQRHLELYREAQAKDEQLLAERMKRSEPEVGS